MSLPLPITDATVAALVADSAAFKQRMLADRALLSATATVAQVCVDAYRAGNKLLIAGNGGSAADAQHFSAELVARFEFDRPGLPAIALTTDTSALTAIGNDYGYERLFSRQVEALARPGDVFVGLSTSGNSRNVLKAMEQARSQGVICVALCGQGGRIHELADHVLAMPSTHTPRIQEGHGLIVHILCAMIESALFAAEHQPEPTA
ncbi:phosphoheptose isomerase [Hydrocarboniphaga daqingensis]|uniref:Phosphoheptose isomerase n=1 Tax=Hydrocarboniphaga daqingensis TaxID=490188 RepID=A0A1M5P6P0_9GAMM|nr:D-sedoheptulose 7-phosphate isomerase [Hydrocarboniphaga daqingensis]SHG97357.1 phosphoheptose isomerase [Hydrocarboniphaga daqingensis]